MTRKRSRWTMIALLGLIIIGAAVFAAVLFEATGPGAAPTPLPRFITFDQANAPETPITRTPLDEARAALESGQAIVVDVRDRDSYQHSHIAGAASIPADELDQRLGELDKQKWIITYCA